jgi:methionyl-tRNA synthetase
MAIFADPLILQKMVSAQLGIAMWLICVIFIWITTWKGIALWKSGRHGQKIWFIVLLVVQTLGILEIIYLLFFQRKERRRNRTRGR